MRGVSANHRLTAWLFLVGLTMLVAPDAIRAQPYPVPDTWGGTFSPDRGSPAIGTDHEMSSPRRASCSTSICC
jgi:hypothetical protein